MHRSDKERLVAELTERLRRAETLIVADYRGLTVTEIGDLRGKLLEHGASFSVVKNTLTRRAAEAAGVDTLLALLDGPTAIAFLESGGDPVAVAKALDDAAKSKVLIVRGGLLDGAEIGADDVKQLAKLPPTDVLRAQLVGALAGSLTAVVGLFAAPMRELVGVLDARIRQLEETGEGAEAPAEEPQAEPAAEEPGADEAPEAEAAREPETAPEETLQQSVAKSEEGAADVEGAEEPAVEEPAEEASAAEESAVEEAAAEEPVVEEPVAEEPAEEPAAEEPAAEEPAAEEPAAEEPQESQDGEEQ
jgi:large subunit ribosomal protein L10